MPDPCDPDNPDNPYDPDNPDPYDPYDACGAESRLLTTMSKNNPSRANARREKMNTWWFPSIEEGYRGSYLRSQWQVRVLHNGSFQNWSWFKRQDDLETR